MLFTVTTASAVPATKLAQARAVKADIDKLDERVEIASERYNAASETHGKLLSQKKTVEKRLKKLKSRMNVVQKHLSVRANSMYREGPMGFVDVLLGAESFEEFTTTWDILKGFNVNDAEAVSELRTLRAAAGVAQKELAGKERAAAKQVTVMAQNRRSILAQLAERRSKLSGLESEISALRAAEERASARRASSFVSSGVRNYPPPTNKARAEIVPFARRFLGVPYVWGGSSPSGFDCSGFTSYVYRNAAGVSIPRTSRAQAGFGQPVSRGDLQPGDLVFFGSPVHHVGIYVGGGMMIHSPRTGDVVKYASIGRSDYSGARRP
jgi:cell wall-associated NlpC family hydrolase